jgi:hypothetical protein
MAVYWAYSSQPHGFIEERRLAAANRVKMCESWVGRSFGHARSWQTRMQLGSLVPSVGILTVMTSTILQSVMFPAWQRQERDCIPYVQ